MNLYTFIAYDQEKNLGKAYNECVSLLKDDDWFVFLDHDAMFVQRDWYTYVIQIIESNPEYDLFTCSTNRIGCPWQSIQGIDKNNHEIRYHKEIGKELRTRDISVVDVSNSLRLSGVVIISNKKAWDSVGGAKDGFLGVDNDIHDKFVREGMKVGFIPSLYVYHWYRGDGDISHLP